MDLKSAINTLYSAVDKAIQKSIIPEEEKLKNPSITDFESRQRYHLYNSIVSGVKQLRNSIANINNAKLYTIAESLNPENLDDLKTKIEQIASLTADIPQSDQHTPKTPELPGVIKDEITADLKEINKCFEAGCYRSATIICGRILEAVLHRKYFEATGQDILEKNPGIGLGKLIAKLEEKNVKLDPGLTQQIHLINQVRIFSVHKKQRAFYPTKEQAQAMILYTSDILNKLF